MKTVYLATFLLLFSFSFMAKIEDTPKIIRIGSETVAENENSTEIDIELKFYWGLFYLKAIVKDPNPEEPIQWNAVAFPVATCTILNWPYPEDATFAEYPFLYKQITFSQLPTYCEVTLSVGGLTRTKLFTIWSDGTVSEGI